MLARLLAGSAILALAACSTQTHAALFSGGGSSAGYTYQVYPSCAQPPNAATGTTYYMKPAASGGSDAANGLTLGTAWATGNHAVATMSAGDQTLAETGSYPAMTINRSMASFTYIKADAGQTPTFASIAYSGAGKWVIDGLHVRAASGGFTALWNVSGTNNDIVAANLDVSSADRATVNGWTQPNWDENALASDGIGIDGTGSCIALDYPTVYNVYRAFSINAVSSVLVNHPTAYWFSGDGIDYSTNSLEVAFATLRDSIWANTGNHSDMMQGQGCGNSCLYTGVSIHDSTITELTTDTPPFPTYNDANGAMDGLTAFDSEWDTVNLYNNVIVATGPYLIQVSACTNCNIENNSLASPVHGVGVKPGVEVDWKQKATDQGSSNVLTRNNITPNIEVDCTGNSSCQSTFTFDHNKVINGGNIDWWAGGSNTFNNSVGCYPTGGDTNCITTTTPAQFWTTYVPATPAYNFVLFPSTSPGLGAGTLPAPVCPNGTARGSNPDLGAYC